LTSNNKHDTSASLREFDLIARSNPCATVRLPGGVVDTSDAWRKRIAEAVSDHSARSRLADTLTGCEVLAWFIDRFSIYGAGRSVPAKLLLHQIMDVIDELCKLRSKGSDFTKALRACFLGDDEKAFRKQITDLWIVRHRTHGSACRGTRDHGYDYFPAIGDAWKCTIEVINKLGGDCSDYSGVLNDLCCREEERRKHQEKMSSNLL